MTEELGLRFNPPPGWPKPPDGWIPPRGWKPDPSWPAPPPGWELWIPREATRNKHAEDAPGTNPISAQSDSSNGQDARLAFLEAENAALRARLETVRGDDVILLDDECVLQDVGIYRYHHPLENAVAYKDRLEDLSNGIAQLVKSGAAIEKSSRFTFNGSLAQGRKVTSDLASLMLRAYNAEVESAVRSLRAGNVVTARKRVERARSAIARFGRMMEMRISDAFHALRIEEIELTADYLMKKQEEREAEREARERLREEQAAALEFAAEGDRLEKERAHIITALDKLRACGSTDAGLESKVAELDSAIEQNERRAANIRAGYVYVISNRGAFGDHVVKIGMTRRLEPMERIYELGDASVPFRFDVHALYFSQDAVTLENELHRHFASRRVNWANLRREFFFATPAEVRSALLESVGNLLEFRELVESTEYWQSVGYWPENSVAGPMRSSLVAGS